MNSDSRFTNLSKILVLSILPGLFVGNARAQLANTRWTATVNVPIPLDCLLKFNDTSASMIYVGERPVTFQDMNGNPFTAARNDSATIEQIRYSLSPGNLFSFTKVSGGSPCDINVVGKYRFTIKGDTLTLAVVDDSCPARAASWNLLHLKKL